MQRSVANRKWSSISFKPLPFSVDCLQFEGKYEMLMIEEESLTIRVPVGANFIQTPSKSVPSMFTIDFLS